MQSLRHTCSLARQGRRAFSHSAGHYVSHFGRAYRLGTEEIRALKELECRVFANDQAANAHLTRSMRAAKKQQAVEESDSIWELGKRILKGGKNRDFGKLKRVGRGPSLILDIYSAALAAASATGRRRTLEDTHFTAELEVLLAGRVRKIHVSAVFDGRDGDQCAKHAAKELPHQLIKYLADFNGGGISTAGMVNALTLCLVDLSQAYNPDAIVQYNENAGCTANVALELDGHLWVANTGDSMAMRVLPDGTHELLSAAVGPFEVHKRLREEEGYSPLGSARAAKGAALGQHWANGRISARPDVVKVPSVAGALLVQTCDGITDVASTADIAKRVKKQGSVTDICQDLIKSAYECGSQDNLTVVAHRTQEID